MPYIQDDLTWCIQKARKLPWLFNPFVILSPAVWIITVFGYGYGCGTLLYLLIQFDAKYKKRNQRDWHYTVFMVALPSVIGVGQRFYPQSWKIRIFYACMLVTLIIGVQMCLGYFLTFLRIQSPMYQVNTVKELISYQYTLMGSAQVQQLAWTAEKVIIFTYYQVFCRNLLKVDVFIQTNDFDYFAHKFCEIQEKKLNFGNFTPFCDINRPDPL